MKDIIDIEKIFEIEKVQQKEQKLVLFKQCLEQLQKISDELQKAKVATILALECGKAGLEDEGLEVYEMIKNNKFVDEKLAYIAEVEILSHIAKGLAIYGKYERAAEIARMIKNSGIMKDTLESIEYWRARNQSENK